MNPDPPHIQSLAQFVLAFEADNPHDQEGIRDAWLVFADALEAELGPDNVRVLYAQDVAEKPANRRFARFDACFDKRYGVEREGTLGTIAQPWQDPEIIEVVLLAKKRYASNPNPRYSHMGHQHGGGCVVWDKFFG